MKTFITFGTSVGSDGKKYYEAVKRITTQATNTNLFTNIIGYSEQDLINDEQFWNTHSEFITTNPRGYGYWLWKPYIIKKTMEQMNDEDILLYLDCGCEININKTDIITNFFEFVKTDYIIGATTFAEKYWNKMDLLTKLNATDGKYIDTPQIQAGAILLLVCPLTRAIINEWYELACDYHNIDDTPSINKNCIGFKEHRHDQSIFSLLLKKHNININHNISNCIEYIRNRTGNSRLS
jgi:hypothetical protein